MIIQTGMRTDIPAFYSEWFINRIQEGFVYTRNPYYPNQVTKYRLTPEVVDVLVFCSKNPAPLLPYMDILAPYGQYWFVTITPYGTDIEPNVPAKEKVIAAFQKLSQIVGRNSIGWRYDPIFINDTYSLERHLTDFEQMASLLSGYTHTCVISFIDLYQKVQRNFPEARAVSHDECVIIGKEFVRIGKKYDIIIKSCAEGEELAPYGVNCEGCMTLPVFEQAIQCSLDVPKQKSQRSACACLLGKDIGQYDTCAHFCKYCYANTNVTAVKRNRSCHNPHSPFLTGSLQPEDVIHEAVQKSWKNGQLKLSFS